MKFFSKILFLFILISNYSILAQKTKIAIADKQYQNMEYIDAIATYQRVAEKGYKDEKMFQKLGNTYYFNAYFEQAYKWYTALFEMNPNQDAEYYYRYAQTLKTMGNYIQANKMLDVFNQKSGNDQRAKLYNAKRNYLDEIRNNSGRYSITDAGINSKYSDHGTTFLDNKLVFTSARDTGVLNKSRLKWSNQAYTNIYTSELRSDGTLGVPTRMSNRINSRFHESTPTFTKDGNTMYFTRNNYLNGKKGKNHQGITLLKLYKATKDSDNQWSNIIELPFNSDAYSIAHPTLSPDEKILYFASDMPGTIGQSDLYRVSILTDGTYSKPENLGSTINTQGKETFPFVSKDNELYFASDGHPGLGGLDLFVTKKNGDSLQEIHNLGEPINSPYDDFGYWLESQSRNGFFTSNRTGGKGYDDIYKFTETRKLDCEQMIVGTITDQETQQAVASAKVSLFDENFKLIKETMTTELGNYTFEIECQKMYYLRVEKQTYETKEDKLAIGKTTGKTDASMKLEKRIKTVTVGTDLAKTLQIPMIYFDLDKAIILESAAFELEKIVAILNQYPKMKLDIRSHTDSRQTAAYNQKLSNARAQATKQWLIQNGIQADRLTAKGYGESQLINSCADGVPCSESEHQANRRSEFVITELK